VKNIYHLSQIEGPGLYKLGDISLNSSVDICEKLSQPVLYLTDEKVSEEALKMIAEKAGIDPQLLANGLVPSDKWQDLVDEAGRANESKLFIDSKPENLEELRKIVFEARQKLGVRHIIIHEMDPSQKLDDLAAQMGTLVFI